MVFSFIHGLIKMKVVYTILILFTIVTCCHANENSIGYVPICKHFNNNPDLNEVNHGIFLFHDDLVIGTFENSGYIRSYFIGKTFDTKKWKLFSNEIFTKLNINIGLLYGYGEHLPDILGWSIGIMPTFEIGYKKFSIETMVFPVDGGVVSCMFKWSFRLDIQTMK